MSLGERIKELRLKRGLTQDEIAEKLGMKRANFSNYERNSTVPPSNTLAQIAEILKTTPDYLLGFTEDPSPIRYEIPDWATAKDKRDFKKMLEDDTPVMFDGVPIEGDARQRVMDILTGLFWEAKDMNKKTYGRKKKTTESTDKE